MQRLAKNVIIIHNEWLKERKFIIDKIYFLISKSIMIWIWNNCSLMIPFFL